MPKLEEGVGIRIGGKNIVGIVLEWDALEDHTGVVIRVSHAFAHIVCT